MQLAIVAAVLTTGVWAISIIIDALTSRRRDRQLDAYEAYCALLAAPDAADLPKRGRKYTQPGTTRRDAVKRDLGRAYVGHRLQDAGREQTTIVSVRRSVLRLVGRRRA